MGAGSFRRLKFYEFPFPGPMTGREKTKSFPWQASLFGALLYMMGGGWRSPPLFLSVFIIYCKEPKIIRFILKFSYKRITTLGGG